MVGQAVTFLSDPAVRAADPTAAVRFLAAKGLHPAEMAAAFSQAGLPPPPPPPVVTYPPPPPAAGAAAAAHGTAPPGDGGGSWRSAAVGGAVALGAFTALRELARRYVVPLYFPDLVPSGVAATVGGDAGRHGSGGCTAPGGGARLHGRRRRGTDEGSSSDGAGGGSGGGGSGERGRRHRDGSGRASSDGDGSLSDAALSRRLTDMRAELDELMATVARRQQRRRRRRQQGGTDLVSGTPNGSRGGGDDGGSGGGTGGASPPHLTVGVDAGAVSVPGVAAVWGGGDAGVDADGEEDDDFMSMDPPDVAVFTSSLNAWGRGDTFGAAPAVSGDADGATPAALRDADGATSANGAGSTAAVAVAGGDGDDAAAAVAEEGASIQDENAPPDAAG